MRKGGGGAPGPDLGNHLVNRHGRVNVNPGCMFTGGGSLGLKPSTEVFNKKSPTYYVQHIDLYCVMVENNENQAWGNNLKKSCLKVWNSCIQIVINYMKRC